MTFNNTSQYLAICADKQIKIFYNFTSPKVAIDDLIYKLKQTKTQASKERLEELINSYKYFFSIFIKNFLNTIIFFIFIYRNLLNFKHHPAQ